jgi:hypothetical protein
VASLGASMSFTIPAGEGELYAPELADTLIGNTVNVTVMGVQLAGRVTEANVMQEGQLLRLTVTVE